MKKRKRTWVFISICAILLFSVLSPIQALAEQIPVEEKDIELDDRAEVHEATIDTATEDSVPLYQEKTDTSEILTYLTDGQIVNVLEEDKNFSLVEYLEESSEGTIWKGYVNNDNLDINQEQSSESENEVNPEEEPLKTDDSNGTEEKTPETDEQNKTEEDATSTKNDETEGSDDTLSKEDEEAAKTNNKISEESFEKVEEIEKKGNKRAFNSTTSMKKQTTYQGIALKSKTHVYADTSRNKAIKSYSVGTILKYRSFNSQWYEATVFISGEAKTGYINKSDVENIQNKQVELKGVALKSKTNVYSKASTNSSVLKHYSSGSVLKYKTFSSNWYEAVVYVDGNKKTGYIHKSHVENVKQNQVELIGVALKDKTNVYSETSTSSEVLKDYSVGSILKYKTFSNNWYEATIYINGKRKTGYIHKSHVENKISKQKALKGIGIKSPTHVYSQASTNSKKLKSYSKGSILKYKTFSNNWYEATVYINGKRKTGYIHKSHVENKISKQKALKGIGIKNPTHVYSEASTNSKKLKSYSKGSILKYKTFSNNWYEATVYINGKKKTGYIHKSHVSDIYNKQKLREGRAIKKPTHVYSSASKSSKPIKSYKFGSLLKFKTFTKDWYEATVYLNGKAHTGYIHVNDVGDKNLVEKTKYNYSFKDLVDRQMTQNPKSDGAGKVSATRGEVEFYSNPLNFGPGTNGYYQFLVLSQPLGLSAYEINELLLNDAGKLKGMGKAFVDASKKYQINEAYLVAHALHETGNGKSALSNGIPVDKNGHVTRNNEGKVTKTSKTAHVVYNMYGYGAYDSCPIDCGAKYAFDQGWFTLADSITGGAQSILSYVGRGQDTLYKMRWNPDPEIPNYLQYATHVQWAALQTRKISQAYNNLNKHASVFDIPTYNNMPDYNKGTYGITQASSLNLRSGPGTNYDQLGGLSQGTTIKIIGSDINGWYNIEHNGKSGWVSAKYVHLKY